jgi:hypothetical protein
VPGMSVWPAPAELVPRTFDQLTMLELLVLAAKLHGGQRRARRAALRARSVRQIWDMIRLSNHLADLGDDVSRALARY